MANAPALWARRGTVMRKSIGEGMKDAFFGNTASRRPRSAMVAVVMRRYRTSSATERVESEVMTLERHAVDIAEAIEIFTP